MAFSAASTPYPLSTRSCRARSRKLSASSQKIGLVPCRIGAVRRVPVSSSIGCRPQTAPGTRCSILGENTRLQPKSAQDPSSRLNYINNWLPWLGEGNSITARLWTITPLNNTTPETPILTNPTAATVFVEGLINGRVYHLVEHITHNSERPPGRSVNHH